MSRKAYLRSQTKSTGTAYLLFIFLFGSHFAYLGKWGTQFLFWLTLYGFGIWAIVEIFMIPTRVSEHNMKIYRQIEKIEKQEREEEMAAQVKAMKEGEK
ncbi:TM2 domain-containing protein [Muricauda sp. SCSIO 64092]|uniref:TM2 domain-containing protein n=1 Tax=Allomuricauda sp. SCSIO 64092 TaxID=2908842 RepID=UPI001FF533A1|nr:TM2 domain-containing protein [Muricauda sp. SCSIO 64092]UOY07720.1 TM2 domain-containing protein [Muricauda sp. SCSIO 64092]